jgi:hypothetical protein
LGCLAIKVKVDDVRSRAAVMAYQIGQQGVEQVGVQRYLYHRRL